MTVPKISGIILASGFSTRMGCNKLLLPWPPSRFSREKSVKNCAQQTRPLLQWVLDAAKQSLLHEIIVVIPEVNTEAGHALRTEIDMRGCIVLENPLRSLGQSEALKVGVQHLVMHPSPELQGAMVLLGDQPFLTTSTLNTLVVTAQKNPQAWIVPSLATAQDVASQKDMAWDTTSQRGNPVIIPSVEFARVLQLEGDTGARPLLENSLFSKVCVPVAEDGPFIDIDTQVAYEKYRDVDDISIFSEC